MEHEQGGMMQIPKICANHLYLGLMPQYMHPAMTAALCGLEYSHSVEDIHVDDEEKAAAIKMIQEAQKSADFYKATENMEMINLAGCTTLNHYTTKDELVKALCSFLVLDRNKEAITKLAKGLDCLNIMYRLEFLHQQG